MATRVTVITPPTDTPVTLTEAKAWLRVTDDAEDSLITSAIKTATDYVERWLRRSLMTQTLQAHWNQWPRDGVIELLRPPIQSMTSIQWRYNASSSYQTLDPNLYVFDCPDADWPARITRRYSAVWPYLYGEPDSILIQYVAGWSVVPEEIRTAILRMVERVFDSRGQSMDGRLSDGVEDLLRPYRVLTVMS